MQDVRSPYSGEIVARVEYASLDAVDRAIDIAAGTFADRAAWIPAYERASILKRSANLLRDRAEDFAHTIALEGGKPLADARIEVARAANTFDLSAEEATRVHGDEIPMRGTPAAAGRLAFTTREPIGVVAAISAFNHPVNLIAHQAAPAIAAGCPVLVKPAPETPVSAIRVIELLVEAGLPRAWTTVLPGDADVGERLATSPRIAYLSFIGSARVGWMLRGKIAPGVRIGLEHGGVAPFIVDETADLGAVVPQILKGGFYHAGQVCVSVQRVFAHKAIAVDLTRRIAEGAGRLIVGDPLDEKTQVGPIIRARDIERIQAWIDKAADAGARVVCGGRALPHQSYAPTVIADPPDDSLLMNEEIFGPVVAVRAYADDDEAIALANATPWSFQAAVATRDIGRAFHFASRLDASAVMVNDHTAFRVDGMPFGGRKKSGLGVGGVPFAVRELTQEKLIVVRAE
ncbi:aldehyde dehydrogenase family protein [bacterium]|nr:aldehyde dehydrogenase family protein [bacterium]